MKFTERRLAAMYDLLRTMPPFNRWKLPPSDQVNFCASARRDCMGEHTVHRSCHRVMVSTLKHGHFDSVLETLGHEMVHMAQAIDGEQRTHGEGFERRARAVGKAFGWDWRAL